MNVHHVICMKKMNRGIKMKWEFVELRELFDKLINQAKLWSPDEVLVNTKKLGDLVEFQLQGRVLMSSPKMLLLDEPTAGVNPALTEKLFQKIVELKNNLGLTILLIEHDMDVIMRAEVDHVYVANQGEIITHGSPEEVKQNKEVIEAYLGK